MPIPDHVLECAQEAIQRAVEELANHELSPAVRGKRALAWASKASRMLAIGECPHSDPKLWEALKT